MRCAALTRSGDQCQGVAKYGTFCYFHAPETRQVRAARSAQGGRNRKGAELPTLRREIRELIHDVREGELSLDKAGIMLRAYRALMQLEELRLESVEVQSLRADLEALKGQEAAYLR